MRKPKIEIYREENSLSEFYRDVVLKPINFLRKILEDLHGLLVYLFKYTLVLLLIFFLVVSLIKLSFSLDKTQCNYHSTLIDIKGTCSQIFTIFSFDGDILKLLGADYDYNTFGIVFDWQRNAIDIADKLKLNKTEKQQYINEYQYFFVNELNEAHDIVFD